MSQKQSSSSKSNCQSSNPSESNCQTSTYSETKFHANTLHKCDNLNSTISSLVTVHLKLSPCHHLSLTYVSYIQLFTPYHHFSTILCISQLVFAIDSISHIFNESLKKKKKRSCFSSEYFLKLYSSFVLHKFIHSLK